MLSYASFTSVLKIRFLDELSNLINKNRIERLK